MTLVEVLVVLAIIAVTASVSVLSIGVGSHAGGQVEAARLASRVQLAADRSIIEDSAIALAPAKGGYSFVEWDARRGWQPSAYAPLSKAYELPAGMALASDAARPVLVLGADAGGQPFTLTLTSRSGQWRVGFDGMTAHVLDDRAATRVGA